MRLTSSAFGPGASTTIGLVLYSTILFDVGETLVHVPERVLHVGDMLREDVEGAAQVGIRTVLIDRGNPPSTDYSPQIASLDGLASLLMA